jgi:hypothetical protein
MPIMQSKAGKAERGVVAPVMVALAAKAVALAFLYFAFFVPPAAPTPARTAATVYALPTGR